MKIARPFTTRFEGDLLFIELDSPGSRVNILSPQAAAQLTEIFSHIEVDRTSAVVLQSTKPGSFINGVSMMRATVAKKPSDAWRLTSDVRPAYQSVGECPVPTFAAVQGMCYGCGVELTLFCDYCLADNSAETCFYMTEINDYLFVPVFEGTLRLPLMLGLEHAVDFLLWGEKWTGREAQTRGLVDHVVEHQNWNKEIRRFVHQIVQKPEESRNRDRLARRFRGRADERLLQRTKKRIQALPPAYQPVYLDCLNLIERVFRKGSINSVDRRMEINAAGRSVFRPVAKKALSFFFLRQLAHGASLRCSSRACTINRIRPAKSPSLKDLRADLMSRQLPDVTVDDGPGPSRRSPGHSVALVPAGPRRSARHKFKGIEVVAALDLQVNERALSADAVLYDPLYGGGARLFELASRSAQPWVGDLYNTLARMGYQLVVSHPTSQGYALNRMICAFLAPLVRFRIAGGAAETINYTLRKFGFVQRPAALLAALDDQKLISLLAPEVGVAGSPLSAVLRTMRLQRFEGGHYDRRVIDGLSLSLLAATIRTLDDGTLSHVSLVDLIAREVLDFPLMHCSLCKYLNPPQIQTMVKRAGRFKHLIREEDLELAREHIAARRRFYL